MADIPEEEKSQGRPYQFHSAAAPTVIHLVLRRKGGGEMTSDILAVSLLTYLRLLTDQSVRVAEQPSKEPQNIPPSL